MISAVGDPAALAARDRRRRLPRSSTAATPPSPTSPSAGSSSIEDEITAPAYDGLLDLTYATAAATRSGGTRAARAPRGGSLAPSRRRADGRRLGRGSAASRSACRRRRRLGRLLEGRHHDRHRRALRLRLTAARALLDDGALRLARCRPTWSRTRLEARRRGSPARPRPAVMPDHVGHLLGAVGEQDGDRRCPRAPARRRLAGSRRPGPWARRTPPPRSCDVEAWRPRASSAASLWSWPTTERHRRPAACPSETVRSTVASGVDVLCRGWGPG